MFLSIKCELINSIVSKTVKQHQIENVILQIYNENRLIHRKLCSEFDLMFVEKEK